MRTTKRIDRAQPATVAALLDVLQERQRAARADLEAAARSLVEAGANLDAADDDLVRTARLLGLPVEG